MPAGGYQPPANPAAVSGPGALSQRTDGGPAPAPQLAVSGLPYGDNGPLNQSMTGLPSAQQGMPPAMQGGGAPQPPQQITPLSAPSQYPDEPISHGAPFGPGPNTLSGGPSQQGYQLTDLLGRMLGNDISGRLEDMYLNAEKNSL